jgi:acetyl esterase/lipase
LIVINNLEDGMQSATNAASASGRRAKLRGVLTVVALLAPLGSQAAEPQTGALLWPAPSPELKLQYSDDVETVFDLTYATVSGYRPLTLDLYRVKGISAPRPAVIYIHGGGFAGGTSRMAAPLWGSLDKLAAHIAAQGYVVASINYRLSSEAKFPAQLQDAKAAVRWLRANAQRYGVDPKRIAVWGESVGGSVAALIGTTCGVADLEGTSGNSDQSSCVQAVVDWYGVTDMSQLDAQAPPNATLVHNTPDSTQSQVLGCVLHFQCPASVVNRANPIAYIDPKTSAGAFLILHGDNDTAVSWKQSQILHDALQAKGIVAQFELLQGVNHNFVGATEDQGKHILDVTLRFLADHLGH